MTPERAGFRGPGGGPPQGEAPDPVPNRIITGSGSGAAGGPGAAIAGSGALNGESNGSSGNGGGSAALGRVELITPPMQG